MRTWLIPPPCDGYLAPRQIKPVPPLLFLGPWHPSYCMSYAESFIQCAKGVAKWMISDTSVCEVWRKKIDLLAYYQLPSIEDVQLRR